MRASPGFSSSDRPARPAEATRPPRTDAQHGALHALLVEDDDADAMAVRRTLRDRGAAERVELERVTTLEQGIERLQRGAPDVLLLDLSLPDSRGVESVRSVREHDARVPIVVLTGSDDETTALEALQAGSQDYLAKDELSTPVLKRSIRYAIERKRMEREAEAVQARMLEVQKYESLATLAGGIAHDFNNLLTVVLGNTELVRRDLPAGSSEWRSLAAVSEAARVAADLTEQLLAYGGNRAFRREPVNLSVRIAGMKSLLERLVSDDVSLIVDLAEKLPVVEGDPGQIQQLLMNLVVNGSEAIGERTGWIRVTTSSTDLDAERAAALIGGPRDAGAYVTLRVEDSGCGMESAALGRVFDPFYSSKFPGRGLGLAASLGIARSHGGGFHVESAPDEGACFTAYLPVGTGVDESASPPQQGVAEGAGATVLVVDDDPGVRDLVECTLLRQGHAVILAESGSQAVERLRAQVARVDLVLLDLTMPGMSGECTLRELEAVRPDLRVVLMSGYDAFQVAKHFPGTSPPRLLRKPFSPDELAAAVREEIDAGGG